VEAVVEVAVEVPPQEVQLLDLQQQAQVPVTQLLDQQQLAQVLVEPQEPSEFDAECTPRVEGGRPELGEGRPGLQPVPGRQPAQPGGQQGPRRAPPGEHGGAAARRRQATERPQ